ncbi:ParB family chromosome partitioning protein [Inquilinus ginsengisoli]|uniref:ParB/RepB/Spo0J family partition protein n=1 Tax=Inquilinus ginsengisoli TaxID=363840 RepID=UPI003D1F8674
MIDTTDEVLIPFNKLIPSARNVRKTGGKNVDDLAENIAVEGVLQNLLVIPAKKGRFEVIAGERRRLAFGKLVETGRKAATAPLPCRVRSPEEAERLSLAENALREAMHWLDQFEAFRLLVEAGDSIEDVAARFGVSPTVVARRMKLANVSPVLIEAARNGQATQEQLIALAITDDHALQEEVWKAARHEWDRNPQHLRVSITKGQAHVKHDRIAQFVGVKAYKKAGGAIVRDLFGDDQYLTDAELLQQLARAKLDEAVDAVRAEGWCWVEPVDHFDYGGMSRYGRIYLVPVARSGEESAKLEALQQEAEQIELDHGDEPPDDIAARLQEIDGRVEALSGTTRSFKPEEMAIAGVFVGIDHNGGLRLEKGYVRPEDKRKLATIQDNPRLGPSTEDEVDQETQGLSAKLVEDLSAHRSAALRTMLMDRPDIGLRAVVHALTARVVYDFGGHDVSACHISGTDSHWAIKSSAAGMENARAWTAFVQRREEWRKRLPASTADLWGWIQEQDSDTLLSLLAFCAASTVDVIVKAGGAKPSGTHRHGDKLGAALGLDMGDWWTATAGGYFGRVSKALIVEAARDARGAQDLEVQALGPLKKGSAAVEAERLVAGMRWLPAYLRPKSASAA